MLQGSLKENFRTGTTPDTEELRGYYQVRLVTRLLPPIRFFGHVKFFPMDVRNPEPCSGGWNEFAGRIRLGRFGVSSGKSALGDGQAVLRIIYNRPGNPFWLRLLTDELKQIGPDHYLGRGIIRIGGFRFNSFYFTVAKEGEGAGAAAAIRRRFWRKKRPVTAKTRRPFFRGRREIVMRSVMAALIPRGGAFFAGAKDFDLIGRLNELLDRVDPAVRLALPAALVWLQIRSLVFTGRPLASLSPERATRLLAGMEHSRLMINRHALLIFKLLTMMVFYEQESAARAIGYEHGCHLYPS